MQHPNRDVKPEISTGCAQVLQAAEAPAAVPPHDFVAAGKAGVENLAYVVTEAALLDALARHDYRRAAEAILDHPRSVDFPRLSVAVLEAAAAGNGHVTPEIAIAVRTAVKAVLGQGRA